MKIEHGDQPKLNRPYAQVRKFALMRVMPDAGPEIGDEK